MSQGLEREPQSFHLDQERRRDLRLCAEISGLDSYEWNFWGGPLGQFLRNQDCTRFSNHPRM